jgi:AAA15 family ATPase/GTPase
MKNFMCHEVFDYTPTRKVNFLTGVNGSGKSAVMSALIFGLGGGSKITNRGSANKNLIRTGQGQASVEISLYNRGETAYRSVSFFFVIYYICYFIIIYIIFDQIQFYQDILLDVSMMYLQQIIIFSS